jgi:hypothetical protein
MKTARRRLDVNLDELDRVLAGARQAPLSEDDYEKLKEALHALAAMLVRPRNTEKTSAVLGKSNGSETGAGTEPESNTPAPGHGRNGAEAFVSSRKIAIAHSQLKHGDRCMPGVRKRQRIRAERSESTGFGRRWQRIKSGRMEDVMAKQLVLSQQNARHIEVFKEYCKLPESRWKMR